MDPRDIPNGAPKEDMDAADLRDYFAGKAMQVHMYALSAAKTEPGQTWSDVVASLAYQMADAMLAARVK